MGSGHGRKVFFGLGSGNAQGFMGSGHRGRAKRGLQPMLGCFLWVEVNFYLRFLG